MRAPLLLLVLLAGCSVDRDLSATRFACSTGGQCTTDADAGTQDTGPKPDGGSVDIAACAGAYDGTFTGDDFGYIEATLSGSGALTMTFTSTKHPIGAAGNGQVANDGSISGTSTIQVTGQLKQQDCSMLGSWTYATDTGAWNITRS